DAMQARRDLVAAAAELASGVEARHHKLEGGKTLLLVDVDWDTAAVVVHLHAAVGEKRDHDASGVAGQRLVDGVVDHLVDQVVQASGARRTDVHARTPPHMLPALEDLDLLGGVRHVRAQGLRSPGPLRKGFSNRHYRGLGPPSARKGLGITGQNFRPSILPDFEYENGPRPGP